VREALDKVAARARQRERAEIVAFLRQDETLRSPAFLPGGSCADLIERKAHRMAEELERVESEEGELEEEGD
jgi:hypothetical protein